MSDETDDSDDDIGPPPPAPPPPALHTTEVVNVRGAGLSLVRVRVATGWLYRSVSATDSAWVLVPDPAPGAAVGPAGARGPAGPTGPTGPAGG